MESVFAVQLKVVQAELSACGFGRLPSIGNGATPLVV